MTAHPVCECGHIEADHRIGRSSLGHCRAFGCGCQQFRDVSEDPGVPDAEMERMEKRGQL